VKGLPHYGKTDAGDLSVDKEVFFKMLEDFPEHKEELNLILRYRSYMKGLSMIQGYVDSIHPVDGLIHHTINTNSARTGRQSAKNPNMQNVAKSNAMKILFPVPARKCFVARPDSSLLFVDYAGIEMRLIIEAVKEPTMLPILWDGGDIHALAAEYYFGDMFMKKEVCLRDFLPHNDKLFSEYKEYDGEDRDDVFYKKCYKIMRGAAKQSQFARAYGGDYETTRKALQLPDEIFRPGWEAYGRKFPLVANFTGDSIRMAKRNGYVMTSFGRRLNIERSRVHTAANYRIQGTAAEMLKRSTVLLDKFLQKNYPDIRIIVPIHDELMIHFPNKYMDNVKEITKQMGEEMTKFPQLAVPIDVEWEISHTSWSDKQPLEV
jgi:DNA polymerase-1